MAGDGNHDLYRILYDSSTKKYQEQGNAHVDEFVPRNLQDTGNNYTLIFSTFPRTNIEASYSTDRIYYRQLHFLKKDTVPFINEAEIILSRKELEQGVIIKVKAQNLIIRLEGLENIKETTDTLRL
jgi:hypothetical protein